MSDERLLAAADAVVESWFNDRPYGQLGKAIDELGVALREARKTLERAEIERTQGDMFREPAQ